MKTSHVVLLSFGMAVGLLGFSVQSARAQAGLEPPSVYQAVDQFGVDLTTGTVQVSSPTISVGDPAAGGLSFRATWDGEDAAWRYSTFGEVTEELAKPDPYCLAFTTVVYLGSSNIFQRDGCGSPNYDLIDGYGTLIETPSGYTYTARDGSVALYSGHVRHAPIQSITRLNGDVLTYIGDGVTTNRGYELRFQTLSGGGTRVIALNNAVCAKGDATCASSPDWPSLTFTSVGNERHVTDTLNRTTRVILSTTPGLARVVGIARPSQTTGASITYTQTLVRSWGTVVTAVNDGSATWTYGYESYCGPGPGPCDKPEDAYDLDVTVTDPNSGATVYNIFWTGRIFWDPSLDQQLLRLPSLNSVRNPLNQTTLVNESGVGLNSVTYPEGNGMYVSRNEFGGITQITTTPKPGLGLTATNVTVTYPDCAVDPVRCRLPTSVTDRRGHTTEYTYDAAGNLLTETLPPPTPGAVRPQTRYVWQQQYAWYKQGATAAITQAATPVWVQVEQSQCATLAGQSGVTPAACDGTADEVLTTTTRQVGSSGAASNLLPVSVSAGSGNGALTATTTNTYDGASNVLTVNGPLSGVTDTTRFFYDAMRQPIGQIAPDPDGGSSRPFPATRTIYNVDGQTESAQVGTATAQTDAAFAAMTVLQRVDSLYNAQARKIRDTQYGGSTVFGVTQYAYDTMGRSTCTAVRMNPATFPSLPISACILASAGTFGPDRVAYSTYDAASRLLTTQGGYGTPDVRTVMTQAWTLNGQPDWVEDGNGNRSAYIYDGFDRLAELRYPNATTDHTPNPGDNVEYGYDANDNQVSRLTRNNQPFIATYDALNRPTAINAPDNVGDVAYAYDLLDRRLTATLTPITGPATTVTTGWDALGRLVREEGPLGAFTLEYDLAGRRTRMNWPGSPSFYVTYDWNLDDQMEAIHLGSASADIVAFRYDNLGRRDRLTRSNGVTTSYAYDGASRLTSQSENFSGSGWDQTWGFTYNPAGQAVTRSSSNALYSWSASAGAVAYPINGLNQTGINGGPLPYDAKGNLLGDSVHAFTYDQANKLRGVTGPAAGTLT